MFLSVGDRLGPYEILAPVGAGGMGKVYRAKDTKLKCEVALKVLPDSFARDPERMARFQRDVQAMVLLNHPNIEQICGVEDRALVTELVEGQDLKRSITTRDGSPLRQANRRSFGSRPREGDYTRGFEARQREDHARRCGESDGFRAGQSDRGRGAVP